ncbi:MAG TPA: tetratricopeptide repeat protein [Terriglobia bacterium]|nr:tetratricopeptide repeat protein [Terriglobia bacterium]
MAKHTVVGQPSKIDRLSREQVLRLLSVTERQLRQWERQGWIRPVQPPEAAAPCSRNSLPHKRGAGKPTEAPGGYTFADVAALRAMLRLRRGGVSPSRLKSLREAIRDQLSTTAASRVWNDLQIQNHGRRLSVAFQGKRLEPLTGQFLLDFMAAPARPAVRPINAARRPGPSEAERRTQADRLFLAGLRYEEHPESIPKAIRAYQKATELNPRALGAFINLGTIFYHRGEYEEAEESYRAALSLNPNSALVHFNLGNLLEERGQLEEACAHYQQAVRLDPAYPDPIFNLALLYERLGRHGKACQHWRAYLRLDATSRWAGYARERLRQLPLRVVVPAPPANPAR